ncbi:MAG: acyltransferase family protein [Devosia sp.]
MTAHTPPTSHFLALDGLRGVAALIVVQRHGYFFLGGDMLPAGYLAVDFFFLLSGFVLAHAYDGRLRTTMSPLGFMRARLVRLYPLYLLGLVLCLPLALTTSDHAPAWFAAGLLFSPIFG